MNPFLRLALERLAELRAEAGDPSTFRLWELRATLRGEVGGRVASIASDGGWREERGPARARAWRFAVGAGPGASFPAGGRTLPRRDSLDPAGWEAARFAIEDALRREFRSQTSAAGRLAATAVPDAGRPARVVVEIHLRWRAWRRGSAAPRHAEDLGMRALRAAPAQATLDVAAGRGRPLAWTGPLVLLPPAAGWWAHEMGHAALETAPRIGSVPVPHGLTIVDDPFEGPWPAGFAVDDAGDRARAAVLWNDSGPQVPPRLGRRRRPSVRDAAVGGLSVTQLVGEPSRGVDWSDLPEGTPVASGVRAGRFDPPTGLIALELEGVGSVRNGQYGPGSGHAVALIEAAAGWRGLCALATGPRHAERAFASCSRLGAVVPVMVGAPTIVLDPAQVIP
jgi:hypothetical protein